MKARYRHLAFNGLGVAALALGLCWDSLAVASTPYVVNVNFQATQSGQEACGSFTVPSGKRFTIQHLDASFFNAPSNLSVDPTLAMSTSVLTTFAGGSLSIGVPSPAFLVFKQNGYSVGVVDQAVLAFSDTGGSVCAVPLTTETGFDLNITVGLSGYIDPIPPSLTIPPPPQ